jgi:hypothetical protein
MSVYIFGILALAAAANFAFRRSAVFVVAGIRNPRLSCWEPRSAESGRFGGQSFEEVGSRTDLRITAHLRMRDKQEVMRGDMI